MTRGGRMEDEERAPVHEVVEVAADVLELCGEPPGRGGGAGHSALDVGRDRQLGLENQLCALEAAERGAGEAQVQPQERRDPERDGEDDVADPLEFLEVQAESRRTRPRSKASAATKARKATASASRIGRAASAEHQAPQPARSVHAGERVDDPRQEFSTPRGYTRYRPSQRGENFFLYWKRSL